ncbi:MAG: J domain-containing protein [Cyanobacteria bacterium CRU_2_1]|nr:J domain-containing protein [Cyanobacteria bacterium RU_5_0]NJR58231.1 J domain-containing protein [Cyanobacteria bacterium CRU_2_1]
MELADCYRLLGLRTGASYEDIKASYRRLARRYHPDANPSNQQQAKEKFIQLTEAYRRLISVVQPIRHPLQEPKTDRPIEPKGSPSPPPHIKVKSSPSIQTTPDLSPTDCKLKLSSYEQLQQLLREQRFPRAIALVEGLAQRLPNDIEVRQWQAITYQRFGRYLIGVNQSDKAKLYLKKALRTDPHNKSLWYEIDRDFRRIEPDIL